MGHVQTVHLEVSAAVCPHISVTGALAARAPTAGRWKQKRELFVGITDELSLIIPRDGEVGGRAEGGMGPINNLWKLYQIEWNSFFFAACLDATSDLNLPPEFQIESEREYIF